MSDSHEIKMRPGIGPEVKIDATQGSEHTPPSLFQFWENNELFGYIDAQSRWTCKRCGLKDSTASCAHLLEFLNKYQGDPLRKAYKALTKGNVDH